MRDNSRLPRELIDAVTDILHNDDDRDALLTCSLVCSSWRLSSQRLLFRRVALALDRDDCKRLAQTLLSYPHLADYFRELQVYWYGYRPYEDRESRIEAHLAIDQSPLAAVLRKLSKLGKLQTIILYRLDWSLMTVDLRQSLRWVLMLPSITFLTLDIACYESDPVDLFQHPLTQEDQGENDDEQRPDLEPRHLSQLNLGLGSAGNCHAYVDWFLGPRSRFEVSHIQTLRVDNLREGDGQALNCLLRAIGSSLKHLEFYVPSKERMQSPEQGFNINLELNPNIRVLRLTNISLAEPLGDVDPRSIGMDWLLRFFSNIGTSNKIEQIQLEGLIGTEYRERCSRSGWVQFDRLLAGKFRKLQKLDIMLWATWHENNWFMYTMISLNIRDAHLLLVERGVSVDVWCEYGEWWVVGNDLDLFLP
ncbi:hypothetical protein JB92DRAFT_2837796 [Gautieria morchelliformis]|nr:hypothetical protein JB92DRAFT_2837796 [Gautieria morchelliformis]